MVIKIKLTKKDLIRRVDGRIEWVCEHGIGHTLFSPKEDYAHCCDGCCKKLMKGHLKIGDFS